MPTVLALGGYHLIGRGPQLADQLSGILATDNLLWLYATFFVIKLLHELGHEPLAGEDVGQTDPRLKALAAHDPP